MNYERLRGVLFRMEGAKTKGERATLYAEALRLVAGLEAMKPAEEEALERAYEDGALHALECVASARKAEEATFAAARNSAAGSILNGLENYGQILCSRAEAAVSQHLLERRKKKKSSEPAEGFLKETPL